MNDEGTKEQKRLDYYYRAARFFLIVFLIVALGLYIVHTILDYRYKMVFIKAPCKLCAELNPEIKNCFQIKTQLFPDGKGGWRFENGTPANSAGLQPSFSFSNFSPENLK
jgi:hypothetical protein